VRLRSRAARFLTRREGLNSGPFAKRPAEVLSAPAFVKLFVRVQAHIPDQEMTRIGIDLESKRIPEAAAVHEPGIGIGVGEGMLGGRDGELGRRAGTQVG